MSEKTRNRLGGLLYIFSIIHILYSFYLATSPTIWFDEIYSMLFAFRPAKDLIALTARDVHPPLYYLILRGALLLADKILPSLESEYVAKATSIIPYILLIIYSITFVRKRWGFLSSGLFIFTLCFMPEIMQKTVEIRMYSWALLFVTGLGLHFTDIITSKFEDGRRQISNYIAIFIYSVASIYTHYFAAIAVFWIYIGALLIIGYDCIKKWNRDLNVSKKCLTSIVTIVVVGVIAVICYIPWLSVVVSQVGTVKDDYWIYPLSIKAPYSSAMFLLRANFPVLVIGTCLALLLVLILLYLLYKTISKAKHGDRESVLVIYLFCILPMVALTGYFLSWIIRPIFIDRYLEPSIGLFWLSISILLGKTAEKEYEKNNYQLRALAVYAALSILGINAFVDSYDFYRSEEEIRKKGIEFNDMLLSIDEDTIILTNSDLIQSVVTYSLNTDRRVFGKGESYNQVADYNTYMYMSEIKTLISEMLPGFCYIKDSDEIKQFIDDGKKVLLMTYSGEREEVTNSLKNETDLDTEIVGTYFYDHYDIDVLTVK
ncbi:hypothetical protein [Butyrivibrio sp.]|uniref:hypothetical protein n=1 Tax=Butyrivibrio sp. TaxID=28121 RepID=UPI0025C52169|nr:hypothetical protein [Butyrivibrio sp.]MBE5837312.1 hypothetical protein [Butyrivibrio sp.]